MPGSVKIAQQTAINSFTVNDRLLTIREVADLTNLSVGTLYHFVSQDRIPVVRLSARCIRFRLSALHQWWTQMTENALPQKGD